MILPEKAPQRAFPEDSTTNSSSKDYDSSFQMHTKYEADQKFSNPTKRRATTCF